MRQKKTDEDIRCHLCGGTMRLRRKVDAYEDMPAVASFVCEACGETVLCEIPESSEDQTAPSAELQDVSQL